MFRQQYVERAQSSKVQRMKWQRDSALSKLKVEAQESKAALKEDHMAQRGVEEWEWKMFNYKRYQPDDGSHLVMEKGSNGGAGEPLKMSVIREKNIPLLVSHHKALTGL